MAESENGRKQVQFGIFDWIERDDNPPAQTLEDRLKLLEYADTQAFFCYHLAEHHTTPLSISPSPSIFLSAAAQRTNRIRLGPLVFLLPLYNPLRLIQEICMLDHLSNGRLELGVGRGIVPYEVQRFGVNPEEGRPMFDEALVVLLKGLSNDQLDFQGEYYSYEDIKMWLRPYQLPHPPIWYASGNIDTVPWMAKNGIHTSHIFETNAATKKHFDLYHEIWQAHREDTGRVNNSTAPPKQGQTRHIYIAPTDGEAVKEARDAWTPWFNNINYLWTVGDDSTLDFMRDFDALHAKELIIAGSPQTVREQVWRAIDESSINYFVSIFAWGDIPHEKAMRSMRYFVDEVMPADR